MKEWGISGVTVLTPEDVAKSGGLEIKDGKIERVTREKPKTALTLEIENGVLTPGLINAHDHLLGTYYPKVGNGPYENWLPWDNDLKSAPVYQERQQIENRDLYLLGGYRNLVSAVTTVSDHIPHFVNEQFLDILPMRALRDYALAHSITSFALAWGDGIEAEYQKAAKNDMPFITHIAEGFDPETVRDLKTLDSKGGLGEYSVLVHGIAFSEEDIRLIKKKGASVVWCGDSNVFMFNKTANVDRMIMEGVNLCIGTDSPMSGGLNLLYEMKFDREYYRKTYGKSLSDEHILRMVTLNPARAFRLKKFGQVKPGFVADLAVFANNGKTPYESVVSAGLRDVLLVVINGKPAYGGAEYAWLFDALKIKCQRVVIDGAEKVIIGDLLGLMKRISRAVGFKKELPFLPVQFDV
ncbi:MAG TPA: amidohydrolase family protein [Spirochaetota bacterium]|nr:amidohydrolase family protein [Spirochaetota bacterium]